MTRKSLGWTSSHFTQVLPRSPRVTTVCISYAPGAFPARDSAGGGRGQWKGKGILPLVEWTFCLKKQIMIIRRAGKELVPVPEKVDMVNDEGSAVRPVNAAIGVSAVASRPLWQDLDRDVAIA